MFWKNDDFYPTLAILTLELKKVWARIQSHNQRFLSISKEVVASENGLPIGEDLVLIELCALLVCTFFWLHVSATLLFWCQNTLRLCLFLWIFYLNDLIRRYEKQENENSNSSAKLVFQLIAPVSETKIVFHLSYSKLWLQVQFRIYLMTPGCWVEI